MENFRLKKYWVLIWILFLSTPILFGQQKSIPGGYYNGTENLTGSTLKTTLYNIIKGHTDLGYDGLYNVYKTSDNIVINGTNYVYDMYSIKADGTAAYFYTHATADRCGNYSGEGDCYNREHSFPQSWFGTGTPKSDAFQVYPTDGYVNGHRGNFPYGEVATPTWTSSNGSKLGTCSYPGYTGTVFEPIDEFKGDLARTYFYMATRYENVIAGWPGSDMTNGTSFPCFAPWAINLLLEWNSQDPVSAKEINRNEAIYLLQHNRNPYIDHPEFVSRIWGGNTPGIISNMTLVPAQPKSTDAVSVTAGITDSEGIKSVVLKWGIASGNLGNSITMATTGNNLYTTSGQIPAQNAGVTVYYKIEVTDAMSVVTSGTTQSYTVLQADVAAPVLSFNIANYATNININPQVLINSNEPLFTNLAGTVNSTYLQSNLHCRIGSSTGNAIAFQAAIDGTKKQITLAFPSPLSYKTTYYVEVPTALFEDGAGNETGKYVLYFTTETEPDTQSPVLAITPPDKATDVEINTSIKISSNEPLLTATGQAISPDYLKSVITLKLTDSNGPDLTFTPSISSSNQVITLWPLAPFTNETTYFIKLNFFSFADTSGNLTDSVQTTFTTKSAVDTQAPVFNAGFPVMLGIGSNTFSMAVSINEPGKVYYKLKLKTETVPTIQQLLESAFIDIPEGYRADTLPFEGLIENTAYAVYLLTQDKQGAPNTSSFILKQNCTTNGIVPTITSNPVSETTCPGNSALFICKASGTEPVSYQWYFGETPIQNAVNDTLLIASALENQKGLYSCKAANSWGFVFSEKAGLDFFAPITAGSDNQITVKDTVVSVNLTQLLLNSPTENGTWIDFDGSGALSGSVFAPTLAGTGTYRFVYKVANLCSTDSSVIKVIVEGMAPSILNQPQSFTACLNNQVIFEVQAKGTAPFVYEWFFNDYPVANSDNDTLVLKKVNSSYGGVYTCMVTNAWGVTQTVPAVLGFYEVISAGTDNEVTVKNTVTEVDLFNLLLNQPTPNGEWTDTDQTGALNGSLFNPNQAGAGVYHFTYRVTNPCMSDASTITVSVEWPDGNLELYLNGITLFPNPTSGILYLQLPVQVNLLSLQVLGADGKVLKQDFYENIGRSLPVNLSGLGKGIYLIKLQLDSNRVIKKIVIE